MTPDKLAKSGTEHGHQTALFAYVAVAFRHGWDIADAWCEGDSLAEAIHSLPSRPVPALEWFHAIHNQGHGDKVRGGMAKAEGVRKGVPDTFLPWPLYDHNAEFNNQVKFCGLYIEMKKPSERPKTDKAKGGASDEQIAFGEYAKRVGYGFAICYSWDHAAATLRSYIEWGSK